MSSGWKTFLLGITVCLFWLGCSETETPDSGETQAGEVDKNGEGMTAAGEEKAEPLEPVLRLDGPDSPLVLTEMNGVSHRVFEIGEVPYTGKTMEFHEDGVEKKEVVYVDGLLTRTTEWHQNGQKKKEIKVGAAGQRQESYWDETGKPRQKPVASTAAGRRMNWSFSVDRRSIDVAYRGKPSAIILKGFGEPDDTRNGVWVYRGMKVQTTQGVMTTVRFVMRDDIVFQISVEP